MLRRALKISPLVLALALFAGSLGLSFTPIQAQQIASGALDAATNKCTCPDWDGCLCERQAP